MQESDIHHTTPQQSGPDKAQFWSGHMPLFVAAAVLSIGCLLLGYGIGHRQGLSVVGYDADAQDLAEVITKQKATLDSVNKSLNGAVQERDIAISNFNELYADLTQVKSERSQFQSLNVFYREVLRRRGGIAFQVQNMQVKPLPENVFEYMVDLVQISPNKIKSNGSIAIHLIRGDQVLAVPVAQPNFSFQDYARLTGRWTMPSGFVPQFIELHISQAGKVTVKRYVWSKGPEMESLASLQSEIPQIKANAE